MLPVQPVREVLYKKEFVKYDNVEYKNCSPIDYLTRIKNDDRDDTLIPNSYSTPTQKHPLFLYNKSENTEEFFEKNFGNPMCQTSKQHFMVIVDRTEDKVSIKIFYGVKHRRGGVQWYKINKSMQYITVNIKTGDVFVGGLTNYHLKRKCRKTIRRNFFLGEPINILMSSIKNNMSVFTGEPGFDIAFDAVSIFMKHIDTLEDFGGLTFNQRLFKFYLEKRKIKFPDNFHIFARDWIGRDIRKILKKNDNRMVDTIMSHFDVSGKVIKKALHNCNNTNFPLYKFGRKLFGDDWMNQEDGLILACLNSQIGIGDIPPTFLDFVSPDELKRVFKLFKQVVVYQTLNSYTFVDHIKMYCELKGFGENDIKWMSFDDKETFRNEHLDWTDKLQHYKIGTYTRIYPEYMYDVISEPIIDGENTYYPVLLDCSLNYNDESSVQSNCVKTYIGRSSSIIVSLRKGGVNSNERATIEYRLKKQKNKKTIEVDRFQTLGRFNSALSEEWNDVLFKLDKQMLYYTQDERFDTVKIIKKCQNGMEFNSTSYWNDTGNLSWTSTKVEEQNINIFNDFDF